MKIRVTSLLLVVVAVAAASLGQPSTAGPNIGHGRPPGPAVARFPTGFETPNDSEWGFPLGGFGGRLADDASWGVTYPAAPVDRPAVIFVHGNNVDHADWYPVRDAFINAGWDPDDLWALSYNGLGNQAGTDGEGNPRRDAEHFGDPRFDGISRVTSNDVNVPDLFAFIEAVRSFTGSQRFALVGHSLGVTLARQTLKVHPELRADLAAFVAIAGANHGTNLCPPGSEGVVTSCDEIAAGTAWLAALNGPDGSDETYGPARWLTIYDGSGLRDAAFLTSAYAQSPVLKGADNRALSDNHNDLRIYGPNITVYRTWLESAIW